MSQLRSAGSLLWIGQSAPEFSWLVQRIRNMGWQVRCSQAEDTIAGLKELRNSEGSPDRLVIALANRSSYDPELLDTARRCFPCCPLVLGQGQWWDGSQRTGVRELGYHAIPWHRWGDGWLPWLTKDRPEWFEPVAKTRFVHVAGSMEKLVSKTAAKLPPVSVWVATTCIHEWEAWRILANQFGLSVHRVMDVDKAGEQLPSPDCVIIDESQVPRILHANGCPHEQIVGETLVEFKQLLAKQMVEGTRSIWCASLSSVSWPLWAQLEKAGFDEMLIKPIARFDWLLHSRSGLARA